MRKKLICCIYSAFSKKERDGFMAAKDMRELSGIQKLYDPVLYDPVEPQFDDVKRQLEGLPDTIDPEILSLLDPDILALIQDTKTQGQEETCN